MNHRRFWISPGALLAFVLTASAVVLLCVFVAVPFYSDRAERSQAAQVAQVAKQEQQKATVEFLHKFDCTYGVSLKASLSLLEQQQHEASDRALDSLRLARMQGDHRREQLARNAREDALQSAGRLHQLRLDIPTLDGVRPC